MNTEKQKSFLEEKVEKVDGIANDIANIIEKMEKFSEDIKDKIKHIKKK